MVCLLLSESIFPKKMDSLNIISPHSTHTSHKPFHLFYHRYKQYAALIAATAVAGWRFVFAAAVAAWFLHRDDIFLKDVISCSVNSYIPTFLFLFFNSNIAVIIIFSHAYVCINKWLQPTKPV